MLEKYKDSQKFFYDYFKMSFEKNRISHAYLIETNNVSYGFCLAIDLAKFLLCDGVYNEKICSLIDSGNYSNLKIIGDENDIKKDDISVLKNSFSMKSLDNRRQVYIIKDASLMNRSASNSLLKFLEEPEGNVVAILLCSNVVGVLPTISSRCQIISLVNDDDGYSNLFISLYERIKPECEFNEFCYECGSRFFDIYRFFEQNGASVLTFNGFYELSSCVKEFLDFGLYLYFDCLNVKNDVSARYLPDGFDIDSIVEKNSINDIIRKIDVINKFIFNFKFNVNVNLFLDNFIISLER